MEKSGKKCDLENKVKSEDILQKWIDTAKALANDPSSEVLCPNCGEESLKTKDIVISGQDKFERKLYCPKCSAVNFILIRKK